MSLCACFLSARAVALTTATHTLLSSCAQVCSNLMCQFVGEPCVCRLGRALSRPSVRSSVRVLRLAHCSLSELPDSVAELPHLEHLDLRHNRFSALPEATLSCPSIRCVDLRDNLLTLPQHDAARLPHGCVLEHDAGTRRGGTC